MKYDICVLHKTHLVLHEIIVILITLEQIHFKLPMMSSHSTIDKGFTTMHSTLPCSSTNRYEVGTF